MFGDGLSGHAARDCRLGWFRDGSDGAILLLRPLLRVGHKGLNGSLCGDIGLVVLPGLGSRRIHPDHDGVEGATMARRVPFPLSIEQSMKRCVC